MKTGFLTIITGLLALFLPGVGSASPVQADGANGKCPLTFKGQIAAWMDYKSTSDLPVSLGGRYLPQLNYLVKFAGQRQLDFEAAANIWGAYDFHSFDADHAEGAIKTHRAWARYSTSQFELRMGLQKINFGSATLLRPMMWFDKIDSRDPLKLSDGVWGLLARRYFANNANVWLWGLYGNRELKAWEIAETSTNHPEFGGRIQSPVPKGEMGLSCHRRTVNTTDLPPSTSDLSLIPENRIGIDGKWDLGIGVWLEGVWIHKNLVTGMFANQELVSAGADYTFGLGNGLYVSGEHMLASQDSAPFAFTSTASTSAASLAYPWGLFDQAGAIAYCNWTTGAVYYFLNWKKQINDVSLYFIAFWSTDGGSLHQANGSNETYGGRGLQILAAYNY